MSSFENSPQILEIKAFLREIFIAILDTVTDAFKAFYMWLKTVPIPVPPTMLKLFSNNKANFILFCVFALYLFVINIKTYRLFAIDKHNAQRSLARVPEKVLLRHMWLGGDAGAALAMWFLKHKTQHKNFVITALVLLFIQLLVFSFALGFLGFWTFM